MQRDKLSAPRRTTAIALGLTLLAGSASAAEPVPSLDDVMTYLRFDGAERARVLRGEIVGKDFRESDEKEVSIAIVTLFDAPLPRLVNEIREGELIRADREVHDLGMAPG